MSGRRVELWVVGKGPAGVWGPVPVSSSGSRTPRGELPRHLLAELADSGPSGASGPSQLSAITLEDLGLLLAGDLTSPETLSLEELSERYESSHPPSTASVPEQDTAKRWNQLEQWLAKLTDLLQQEEQGREVACGALQKNQEDSSRRVDLEVARMQAEATRSLLRELLQVRARVQLQGSELRQLQQEVRPAAQAPEKEAPEFSGLQNQMQALDKRPSVQQESSCWGGDKAPRLCPACLAGDTRVTSLLPCRGLVVAGGPSLGGIGGGCQAQVTKLGEEVSLRFLKREAKLCGFLQKSFLALEKRMKASESSRLRLEGSLRGELESRWEKLRGLMEERLRALQGQHEESHLLEQCQGLDAAVAQLTKFVQQNQASLNRVLLAEAKAWDAKGRLEESRAGELAAYVQENLEAAQLARELARQEMHGELVLLQEKNRALEASVAQLAGQLKELSGRLPALSSRLDLQEQMLGLRLSEAKTEWEGAERKSLEDLARWQKEVAAHLRGVREKVDGLPQQIEGVSDKCLLHKSDSDLRISAEGKAREFEVGALRQELATLLSSVQLLKEDSPGRKIAEMQGKLATFQNQIMKLENCVQASKTIQNLRFNTEARLRTQEMAALRESVLQLRSEEGPQAPLGSRKLLPSLARLRVFIKDTAPNEVVPVNCWGVYQAVRWLQWKASLIKLRAPRRPGGVPEKPHSQEQVQQLTPSLFIQK
ncbi:PREDICTED: coiled-coil domain-containing protein 154 [Mandrillus leucophaeus]|uniref:coiled-coil domain-containing protein 154 n=1 Tax=Mandrillus leucophaeus TaxID=9568 RepID=UPI0005F3B793|nr:PREDICTED: coiled-coil domain-containing protein 154 [Mandrillus leucophaeus]